MGMCGKDDISSCNELENVGVGSQETTRRTLPIPIPFLSDAFSSIVMQKSESTYHSYQQQRIRKLPSESKSQSLQFTATTSTSLFISPSAPTFSQSHQFSIFHDAISSGGKYLWENGTFLTPPTSSSLPGMGEDTRLFGSEMGAVDAPGSELEGSSNFSGNGNDEKSNHHEGNFTLPANFTEISDLNKDCIIVYAILFLLAAVCNLLALSCVSRHDRLGKSRTPLLIMNLCIADLIVTFFLMPTEIVWRLTIAWRGGDILCKLCQFIRAFGLYLSSNVVICISVDRYFAIVYPLKLAGAVKRVKWMLVGAWIFSAVFAAPQMIIYHVASHPLYPEFRQCVTKTFLKADPYNELIYNVSSVAALYFIPLMVIIYTYTMILWKIHRKSKEHQLASQQESTGTGIGQGMLTSANCNETSGSSHFLHPSSANRCQSERFVHQRQHWSIRKRLPSKRTRPILRSSANQTATLSRARSRTLKLTLFILLSFIICYSPYVVMTLWYMLDRGGASQVDERLQEALFIMAVTNSVINPLIYNSFKRREDCQMLIRSYPWVHHRVIKRICCCCHNRCLEAGENNYSETVILTFNNRTNNIAARSSFQSRQSHGAVVSLGKLNPRCDPPSPLPPRRQIVTVRTESSSVLRFIRTFGHSNSTISEFEIDDEHSQSLLNNGRDDHFQKVIAMHSRYLSNGVEQEASGCSQDSTPV